MTFKNILIASRYKFANAVHDTKDIIDSYNESAMIPELDTVSEKFNKILNDYDLLIQEAIFYIDDTEADET